jgi:hypothetical protein
MLAEYTELPAIWTRDVEPQLTVEWARAAGLFNARVELTPDELRYLHTSSSGSSNRSRSALMSTCPQTQRRCGCSRFFYPS